MALPFDQLLRRERFIKKHPAWSICPQDGGVRFTAEKTEGKNRLDAFDIKAVYNRDKRQVTIHATITDATPQAIRDLLTDPRADHNAPPSQPGTTGQDHISHLTGHTGASPQASTTIRRPGASGARTAGGRWRSYRRGWPSRRRR